MKKAVWLFFVFFLSLSLSGNLYATEIDILYTGETHAMLYPCSCPKEPDGGIARRATLVKQLRSKNPNTLLLDAGSFFAGGQMDEYTQNTQLDTERTLVNLKAMELMQYDAVTVGDDEFNFGKEFLEEKIAASKIKFLSCNTVSGKLLPFVLKEVKGIKIGIIGVTGLSANFKAVGMEFTEPKAAVSQSVEQLKKEGADIIVLLSRLGDADDIGLLGEVQGIDIAILGRSRAKEDLSFKLGQTIVVRPSWQGRRLGKLSLDVVDKKIKAYKAEELRVSDQLSDDSAMIAIRPKCFSDNNCKKQGTVGVCQKPGAMDSACIFNQASQVRLLVIKPKDCSTCDTEGVVNFLKKPLPGLAVSYLSYPEAKADKLIKELGIRVLPAYLLGSEIDKEKVVTNLKNHMDKKGDYYILKPDFTGLSYFLDREHIKGRLDLFISLYDKNTVDVLEVIQEFKPTVHFLALQQDGGFEAARGGAEVEECLRGVCVAKYYPEYFYSYITCRAKNINSSWWEDCLGNYDAGKIRACARSAEGNNLLAENAALNKELRIMFGPAYLVNNQEVFSTQGAPKKDELKKVLRR